MLGEYKWRGFTWQIDDADLHKYPGAVPVNEKPKPKKEPSPANKSRRAPKNK